MSRSIHTTRKSIAKLSAQESVETDSVEKARTALQRKRRLKRSVRDERRGQPAPIATTPTSTTPIEQRDNARHVFHGMSVDDVISILNLLPHAAREGISRIQLSLGKEVQLECAEQNSEHDVDPFTGRLGSARMPGVHSGHVLGTYSPRSGLISLFAFVIDEPKLMMPRAACELYLRLHACKTFVHEVAHHHDRTARVRRGRWLADRKENLENYAERMEHEWTQSLVVPYLERKYAGQVEELLTWVEHQGGVRVPLSFFAGDPRTTLRNGLMRWVFCTASAFESWMSDAKRLTTLAGSRIAFAWEVHYCDKYEECLQIVNRVLRDDQWNIEALILKADTLVHLERFDEALENAELVLQREPSQARAWEARGDVLEARHDWPGLLKNSEQWLAQAPGDSERRKYALEHRAIAYCALDKTAEMEEAIRAMLDTGYMKRNPARARKNIFSRAGKPMKEE